MTRIFAEHAPKYWGRGFSPLPLQPKSKQPAAGVKNWSGYCDNLPKQETRDHWLRSCGDCGIGLCLGTAFGDYRIGAVDVDVEWLVEPTKTVLGTCPSAKRGKKGLTIFVRVPRTAKLKSTTLKSHDKRGAIDILVSGRMTVLPPSRHPDTGAEYQWIGKALLDVPFDDLPILDDEKLALLRLLAASEAAGEVATGGTTHEPGLRLVASLVRAGCSDDLIDRIFRSLLPSGYAGNSLEELPEWIRSARKKGFDQAGGKSRNNQTGEDTEAPAVGDLVVQEVQRVGVEFFHDTGKTSYMSVPMAGGMRHFPIRSKSARLWLTHLVYAATRKAITTQKLENTLNLLEARALFDGPCLPVSLRLGGDTTSIAIDLGHDDGRVVRITRAGWDIGAEASIKLVRCPGFGMLPVPVRSNGTALSELRDLLGLDDTNWVKLLAFLLICLRPTGPYMLLLVEGAQGSGKSFLCQTIKRVIDPNQVEKARMPETERDLMIHAQDYYLLSFDNVSGMKNDQSDTLCTLATGGGMATRSLYTNNELFVFQFCRPVIINGISDYASRPDLMERAIPLRMPELTEGRKSELELNAEFDRLLPAVLGELYDIVAAALGRLSATPAPTALRMADCARWLVAAEPSAGLEPGTFMRAIVDAQTETLVERTENDSVIVAILGLIEEHPFEGTVQALLQSITPDHHGPVDRFFPTTPSSLSRHLTRMKPGMAKIGMHVEFGRKNRSGRTIRVWADGQEDMKFSDKPNGQPYF